VSDSSLPTVILCPGQGAQAIGMGRTWAQTSASARATFEQADAVLAHELGTKLSDVCFNGPSDLLHRTDVSQPAIYACSVACWHGLREREGDLTPMAAAGLSLGEYTALHLVGVFSFADGLKLVAQRGRFMQQAAEASNSGMLALIGADEQQAQTVCEQAADGEVLVCANFNAPGQIVLSGHATACERAVATAEGMGLKATPLTVAGAFHSPLMEPAAERMAEALAAAELEAPSVPVWSNVTGRAHDAQDMELLRRRLVEQIVSPVRWEQTCRELVSPGCFGVHSTYRELAPGSVLRGLMRRIDRNVKVTSHDEP
jgi:[acyl-carrier-protein] S-malonyltransferase